MNFVYKMAAIMCASICRASERVSDWLKEAIKWLSEEVRELASKFSKVSGGAGKQIVVFQC